MQRKGVMKKIVFSLIYLLNIPSIKATFPKNIPDRPYIKVMSNDFFICQFPQEVLEYTCICIFLTSVLYPVNNRL